MITQPLHRTIFSFTSHPILLALFISCCVFLAPITAHCLPVDAAPGSTPQRQLQLINAEDLALTNNSQWVIASSMSGGLQKEGALYAVNVASGTSYKLYPEEKTGQHSKIAGCDLPVAPGSFAPHGIALKTLSSGKERLFVVNHGGRESIEVFDLVNGETPSVDWQGCIPLPDGTRANAVDVTFNAATDEIDEIKDAAIYGTTIYVTNMRAPAEDGKPAARWTGNILVWSATAGWATVPDSTMYAPNGLLVADDGNTFYVASWAGGEIIKLSKSRQNAALARQTLSLPFQPDNLRRGHNNTIIATGLRGSPENIAHCTMSSWPCDISIPTGIATIDSETMAVDCIRHIPLQMGTVALPVKDTLWVGPTRGDSVWVIKAGEANRGGCI